MAEVKSFKKKRKLKRKLTTIYKIIRGIERTVCEVPAKIVRQTIQPGPYQGKKGQKQKNKKLGTEQ